MNCIFTDGSEKTEQFCELVKKDVLHFISNQGTRCDSVLIFPPVTSFKRLLIHNLAQAISTELATFSIGRERRRRTVICYKIQLLKDLEVQTEKTQSNPIQNVIRFPAGKIAPATENRRSCPNGGGAAELYRPPAARGTCYTRPAPLSSTGYKRLTEAVALERVEAEASGSLMAADALGRVEADASGHVMETDALGSLEADASGRLTADALVRLEADASGPLMAADALGRLATDTSGQRDDNKSTTARHSASSYSVRRHQAANSKSPAAPRSTGRHRERRPDREVYVPRARRTTSVQAAAEVAESPAKARQYDAIQANQLNISELYLNEVNSDKVKNLNNNKTLLNKTTIDSTTMADNIYNVKAEVSPETWNAKLTEGDGDLLELQRASEEINRSNRRIMKQSFRSDVLIISENKKGVEKTDRKEVVPERKELVHNSVTDNSLVTVVVPPKNGSSVEARHKANLDEDDWDSLYDDNGDCLDSKLVSELTEFVGKVTITKPVCDYKDFQYKNRIADDNFAHVLEVYDFPAEFKTQDLLAVFAAYKSTGFEIKWVDDTHALAVFSSVQIAQEALSQNLPFVKTRPLREGTMESRTKARRCSEFLQPYRTRPETCPALARRLVSGALGVKLKTAAADREKERLVLKEAKERKLLACRQRDEAWEQDYAPTSDK